MIFNNAGLQNIPWEIIIKSFRTHLGENKYDTMAEYAVALHDFIIANKSLFPDEHKDSHLKKLIINALIFLLDVSRSTFPELIDPSKVAEHTAKWDEYKKLLLVLATLELPP